MALALATSIRNAQLDAIRTAADAGAGPALLRFYDGTRPSTGASVTTQTLLAELTLNDPCAPSASGGVLTFTVPFADSAANNTGTATWARLVDSAGTFVADFTVTLSGGGGDVIVGNTSFASGITVTMTALTITIGNA